MEWMKIIGDSIQHIEDHLTEELSADGIAQAVNVSPFYFQRGFSMLCGCTVGEYIRARRLTRAGADLLDSSDSVLDIALRYGYDSPDSFTKAFTRFHGVSPSAARRDKVIPKSFAPLKIRFSLEGGYFMDCKIMKKDAFTVLADAKTFPYEGAKALIPQFWQEHFASGKGASVCGKFGINIDEKMGMESFEYLIADDYDPQKPIPEGFVTRTIPAFTWAVFPCRGAMPEAVQKVNEAIYTEWLPGTKDYKFAAGYCVEFYDDPSKYPKGTEDENYYCEIWIPVCPEAH